MATDNNEPITLEPGEDTDLFEADLAERCEECEAPMASGASFCRHCGYYPTLGRCVDVAEWEQLYDNGEYVGPEEEPPKGLQGIPTWAWLLAGVLGTLILLTFIAGGLTTRGTPERLFLAIGEASVGLVLFLVAHFRFAVSALSRDKDLGITDVVASPFRIWLEGIMDYPAKFPWVLVGAGGLWSVILAHSILGIPYLQLVNWDAPVPKKKATKSMAGAIARSGGSGRDMTLEEAMNEFAGDAGADELEEEPEEEEEKEVQVRIVHGAVVGCVGPSSEDISAIVVAVKMSGRWQEVGVVSDGLTAEHRQKLSSALKRDSAASPFVQCQANAQWLKPVVRCEIEVQFVEGNEEPEQMRLLEVRYRDHAQL